MSIFSGFQTIRRERASLERNRVMMSSMLEGDKIATAFENAIEHDMFEGVDDAELEELIARIPESDPEDEDEQIEKILMSNNDLDIDGVLDIEDSPDVDDVD